MPYVSRKKQFSPEYIDGLFVWLDNSNLIYSRINRNLSNYTFRDTTEFNNDVIGTNNIRLSNAKVIFSNYDYAQSSERLSIPTVPNSFTIFYVGQPGFSKTQNSLVTLFNADSNSIRNSNTIGIVVDNYNIAYATNLQPTGNILDKYNGAYSFIGNRNSINIFTATFDQNNSQLWVNGITNGVISSSCSNIFPIGDIYNNILTIQSNDGFYANNLNWLNSFNETLVYDHILTGAERNIIEGYLANKWRIVYPGSPLTGVSAILGLTNWYNSNTISFQGNSDFIEKINDLSGFSNILENNRTGKLSYSSNYNIILPFNLSALNILTINNAYYSNYIFTTHNLIKGITVSFITTNSFYQKSPPINTSNIMTLFSPQFNNLENSNYPTVKTDGSYNIFAGGNVYSSVNAGNPLFLAKNKFTLSNLNINKLPSSSNIKELCVITMEFIDYKSYGTTQLFMNGYPMMISCNGPSNWLGSNFNLYYAAIPDTTNSDNLFSYSPLDLGETLIYDRILTPSELSVVHQHLLSSYSISNVISSNGLIGWFDAADYSSSVGTVLNTWTSKGGVGLTLSNPDPNSFTLVRNYSNIAGQSNLTFIDLNNGAPSYFVNNTTVPISTYSNLIVFYVVLGNSNLATNGYVTSFGHSNGSITYFAQSGITDVVSGDNYIKQNGLRNVFGNTNFNLLTIQSLTSQIVSVFLSFPSTHATLGNIDPTGYYSPANNFIFSNINIDLDISSDNQTKFNSINSLRTQISNINPIYAPLSVELGVNNWLLYIYLSPQGYIIFNNDNYSNTGKRILEINNILNSNVYATTDFSTNPNNQPIITGAYASNSDNNLMRFDTVSQNTMTIGSVRYNGSNISNINIGAYLGTNFCKTQIGEVLIYNRPLSKYEYINIFGYLQSKWCSPTVVPFPTDYVLRYDACNISLDFSSWQSSENKGPNLSFNNFLNLGSVSFAYFNRPFLSNSIYTQYSSSLISNIDLQKGFTIFTITSNANTTGNIMFMNNTCNNTLKPNIFLSNTGSSNQVIIGNKYNWISTAADATIISNVHSYVPLTSQLLINCVKYYANTSSYSITTKGTNLEINNNNRYRYTNRINSNITFFIGGLGSIGQELGFNSLIGEVLVYNRPLNDYETELVSVNLTEKWNTPLSYPILFESRTISCNFSFSTTSLQSNRLTLCNIPVLSNYYNFPMSILFTSLPSLGNPVRTGVNPFTALYSNVYGSCNYVVTMSTTNPFGSASLILYSNTTPPGIPFFPPDYNAFTVFSNLGIQTSNNTTLVYSNILLTSILCNDAYGYDRNYGLTIWCTLSNNTGQNVIVGTVTCNITSNGLYRSNINITFSNLVEEVGYNLRLFTSNISGISCNIFPRVSLQLGFPFFSNTFVPNGTSQSISYTFSNFTNFRFGTLRGAARASSANNYYVTMTSNNIPITNFTTILSLSAASGSIFSNMSLSLSNLIGMVLYSNITLVASNRTGIMPESSALRTQASNSLGFFTTPPGPPISFSQTRLTSNLNRTTGYLFSNIIVPGLSCNSILYPTGGGGRWDSINNNKSGIFYFFQLRSNTTLLTPNYLGLSNNLNHSIGGRTVTVTTAFIRPPGNSVESNMWFRLTNLPVGPTYQLTTTIYASNLSGIASNVLPTVSY